MMHVTLVAVVSRDGYIADKNGRVDTWASPEDQQHLQRQLQRYRLHVMGSSTYDVVRPKPSTDMMQIVLTSRPYEYAQYAVDGQLEFVDMRPKQMLDRYAEKGYNECLVLGGAQIYTDFMQSGLVSDAYVTLEPVLLKTGVPLFGNGHTVNDMARHAVRETAKKLNDAGTMLWHFIF